MTVKPRTQATSTERRRQRRRTPRVAASTATRDQTTFTVDSHGRGHQQGAIVQPSSSSDGGVSGGRQTLLQHAEPRERWADLYSEDDTTEPAPSRLRDVDNLSQTDGGTDDDSTTTSPDRLGSDLLADMPDSKAKMSKDGKVDTQAVLKEKVEAEIAARVLSADGVEQKCGRLAVDKMKQVPVVFQAPGDGSCQFHCVNWLLKRLNVIDQDLGAQAVRKQAVETIRTNDALRHRFDEALIKTEEVPNIHEWCDRMEDPKEFGDEMTLISMVAKFKLPITVLDLGTGAVTSYRPEGGSEFENSYPLLLANQHYNVGNGLEIWGDIHKSLEADVIPKTPKLPVKNTFIHFQDQQPSDRMRSRSAPASKVQDESMNTLHRLDEEMSANLEGHKPRETAPRLGQGRKSLKQRDVEHKRKEEYGKMRAGGCPEAASDREGFDKTRQDFHSSKENVKDKIAQKAKNGQVNEAMQEAQKLCEKRQRGRSVLREMKACYEAEKLVLPISQKSLDEKTGKQETGKEETGKENTGQKKPGQKKRTAQKNKQSLYADVPPQVQEWLQKVNYEEIEFTKEADALAWNVSKAIIGETEKNSRQLKILTKLMKILHKLMLWQSWVVENA